MKTNDSDEDIRLFLGSFEASLKLSDAEILKQFKVKQTREAILSAIHVLQNKESEYIVCTMAYQNATIERTNDSIKVQIPLSTQPKTSAMTTPGRNPVSHSGWKKNSTALPLSNSAAKNSTKILPR